MRALSKARPQRPPSLGCRRGETPSPPRGEGWGEGVGHQPTARRAVYMSSPFSRSASRSS